MQFGHGGKLPRHTTRLHFGLGKRKRADRIEVHWPRSGVIVIREDLPADQLLTIV
ncbi:MAG: ASPIC/UnbV domain-containing protein [Thermoguttaceae bacterium]